VKIVVALVTLCVLQGCGFYHERKDFWETAMQPDRCDVRGACNVGKQP
jgi:hypothetical protein